MESIITRAQKNYKKEFSNISVSNRLYMFLREIKEDGFVDLYYSPNSRDRNDTYYIFEREDAFERFKKDLEPLLNIKFLTPTTIVGLQGPLYEYPPYCYSNIIEKKDNRYFLPKNLNPDHEGYLYEKIEELQDYIITELMKSHYINNHLIIEDEFYYGTNSRPIKYIDEDNDAEV